MLVVSVSIKDQSVGASLIHLHEVIKVVPNDPMAPLYQRGGTTEVIRPLFRQPCRYQLHVSLHPTQMPPGDGVGPISRGQQPG